MKPRAAGALAALVLLGVPACTSELRGTTTGPDTRPARATSPSRATAANQLAGLPLRFEPNVGQFDPGVRFAARTPGGTVTVGDGQFAVVVGGSRLVTHLAGATPGGPVEGLDAQPGVTNYLRGDDPAGWKTGVPGYGRVLARDAYPGVDMLFHPGDGGLEYDFALKPGADPTAIALDIDGANGVSVDPATGDLLVGLASGQLRQRRPVAYQTVRDARVDVTASFRVDANGRVGFDLGAYDASVPLVIDPTMLFSTFIGGNNSDTAAGLAIDSTGATYVVGTSSSTDFPVSSAFQGSLAAGTDSDAVVVKLAPAGNFLQYATYIGGNHSEIGSGIAIDASGAAYIAGLTTSAVFPTTPTALDHNRTFANGSTTDTSDTYTAAAPTFTTSDQGRFLIGPNVPDDTTVLQVLSPTSVQLSAPATATGSGLSFTLGGRQEGAGFVTKLAASGTSLVYSTYVGGPHFSWARSIAVTGGEAYVTGNTSSPLFPTTAGAFDGNRSFTDGVTNGTTTFTSSTASFNAAADTGRAVIGVNIPPDTSIASVTNATTVELTNAATGSGSGGAFTLGGKPSGVAFLAKVSADGTSLGYSSYLGGTGGDTGYGIALAGTTPVVVGTTNSADFPVKAAVQPAFGSGDAFVTKIDTTVAGNRTGISSVGNAAIAFSTYLGGPSGGEEAHAVAVGPGNAIFVTGLTTSADFPTTAGAFDRTCGTDGNCDSGAADAFVTKYPADGSSLTYSTYLGGAGDDSGNAIAVAPSGTAVVVGKTNAPDFPVAAPLQLRAAEGDAFVTRLAASGASLVMSTYLDGSSDDEARGVVLDATDNLIVAGTTASPDFPTTPGAFDASCGTDAACNGGNQDLFVTRLSNQNGSPPAVGSVVPAGGPPSGGTTVVITGAGFTNAAGVSFGGTPAASFHVDSDTQITATSPAHAAGDVGVTVSNGVGTSVSSRRYRYGEGLFIAGADCPAGCGQAIVRLADGRILAMAPAGGPSSIYDPATRTWTATGTCAACASTVRALLTLLPNGKVLYEGGTGPGGRNGTPAKTAFLYDPAAGTWSQTGDMNGPRFNHGAILLPNGKVLVSGGCTTQAHGCGPTGGDVPTTASEVYDPATGTWSLTGSMIVGRALHPSVYIDPAAGPCGTDCGKVLVAGGVSSGEPQDGAELYDPAAGTWALTRSLHTPRYFDPGYQLPGGRVIVVGGYGLPEAQSSEIYDPATRTWSDTGALAAPSAIGHTVTMLPSGKVLAAGAGDAQIFNPATGTWSLTPPTLKDRRDALAILLTGSFSQCATDCGSILLAGGTDFYASTTSELYRPQPAVTAVTPGSGAAGGRTLVKLTGSGLAGVTQVRFGGTPALSVTPDASTPDAVLWVRTPAHAAGQVDVVAHSPGGDSPVSAATRFVFDSAIPSPAPVGDYDGDGKTDLAVFRPSTGVWYVRTKTGLSVPWGVTGDIAVPADYDGDGKTDLAVFRPSTGVWYVDTPTPTSVVFGTSGDIPVPADYDGDGKADLAVFRPSTGVWYVNTATPLSIAWGSSGDIPVPGDYDGDGKTDLAVYRPSTGVWYVRTATPVSITFGSTNDIPVPSDYDGDGKTDLAVFRPSNGVWYVRTATPSSTAFGVSGDVPVPADYDGAGKVQLGAFRVPVWYLNTNPPAAPSWGAAGDVPVVLPYAIWKPFFG